MFCKEVSDSTRSRTKASLGIRGGLNLSYLNSIKDPSGPPMGSSHYDLEGNRLSAGFSSGFFLDFKSEDNFSIEPQINFIYITHEANLTVVRRYQSGVYSYNDRFSSFIMQICILPKFAVGKKHNFKIMYGPFVKFPLITTSNSSTGDGFQIGVGQIACLRLDAQAKSGVIGFDFRVGSDLASSQNFRETSLTLGLSYVFGLKK
ncbi:MAG: outer membrane beta-barrel protein [Bacteroidales bacterium]|nr:outer membrane beta-barrel protein [Bacteroidales bacterium]MBK7628112.1 outer membrane beta-barrel protein [Bacteroidales bacterium]